MKRISAFTALILALALLTLAGCATQSASQSPSQSQTSEPAREVDLSQFINPTVAKVPREIEPPTPEAEAEWTILFYLCGTDLELGYGVASSNLLEIQQTDANENVNFIVQTGGCLNWRQPESLPIEISSDFTQRWRYDENGWALMDEMLPQNMASSDTLADFIKWTAEYFPAKNYMLILWDHGGGSSMGLIMDPFYDAIMSIADLGRGLRDSGIHFDIVAFDCCLMGNLETAMQIADSADYMVGSEEVVPGYGISYSEWLSDLYANPQMEARELGVRIVDGIFEKYENLSRSLRRSNRPSAETFASTITFSLVDLSLMDDILPVFDEYWVDIASYLDDLDTFAFIGYGALRNAETYSYDPSYGMFDLRGFILGTKLNGSSEEIGDRLDALIDEAVVYYRAAEGRPRSRGLSFWYLPTASAYELDHYARQSKSAGYLSFIDAVNFDWSAPDWVFEKVPRVRDVPREEYKVEGYSLLGDDGTVRYVTTLGTRALVNICYILEYIDDSGDVFRLGEASAVDGDFTQGYFYSVFDGTWPMVEGNPVSISIVYEGTRYDSLNIPVIENGQEQVLRASYIYDNQLNRQVVEDRRGSYSISGIWNGIDSQTGFPGRDVRDIDALYGKEITFYLPRVSRTSGKVSTGGLETGTVRFSADTTITRETLPPGRYQIRFMLRDVFNNVTYSSPVEIRLYENGSTVPPAEGTDSGDSISGTLTL